MHGAMEVTKKRSPRRLSIVDRARGYSRGGRFKMQRQGSVSDLSGFDNEREWYIIDPDSNAKQTWDIMILLLVSANVIMIPICASVVGISVKSGMI